MAIATGHVCGGHHRIAFEAVRAEVSRYWKTVACLVLSLSAGVGLAVPAIALHGRLGADPVPGGDLGLAWRAGVQPVAAVQQQAVDALSGILLGTGLATLGLAAVTSLILALAREAERAAELTVRRAVGAGRRMLLRSALQEGVLVALAGIIAGGLVGAVVVRSSPRWPGLLRPGSVAPVTLAVAALAVVVITGVLFPVLLPRRRIGEAEPRSPTPLTPSAIQVAATLVALTVGALLAGAATGLMATPDAAGAERAVYALDLPGIAPAERARSFSELLEALTGKGRMKASLTSPGVLLGLGPVAAVTTDCGQCSEGGLPIRWRVKAATHRIVSADTFEMVGIRLVEGRGITDQDAWEAPRVAVVNRSLAIREFQNGEAIGRAIRVVDDGDQWSTVVGVVDDPPAVGLGATIQPHYSVYLSVLQHPPSAVELLTVGSPASGGRRLDAIVAGQAAPLRWFAWHFTVQGWVMLGVAALGSLAVTRLWVESLLVELGIRRALGARRRRVISLVLLRAVGVCIAGIALGVWVGGAIWSMLGGLVPGLEPWDAGLVCRFGASLLACTLLGTLPSAWRAARATPASLLAAS
jgi:hypothetical protein